MEKVNLKFPAKFEGELITDNGTIKTGREDGSMKPYELLLGGLGGCFYATFIDIVKKMQLEYSSAEIKVTGNHREETPRLLNKVDIDFKIIGADKDQEDKFQRAAELGAKYCSIYQTLSNVAQMNLNVELE